MGKKTNWLITGLMTTLSMTSFAALVPFTDADCGALAMPQTALVVHASWCSACKAFMPTYEEISNQEKYKGWVFYEIVNDGLSFKFEDVCGVAIHAVPITFKNNMQTSLLGNAPKVMLEQFLDKS